MTMLQITPPISGKLVLPNGSYFDIVKGLTSAPIEPNMNLAIHWSGHEKPAALTVPDKIEEPLIVNVDAWKDEFGREEAKKNRKNFGDQLKSQSKLLAYIGLGILVLGLLSMLYLGLMNQGGVQSIYTITEIGGWMTVFIVILLQASAFLDAAKRQQIQDWWVCFEMLIVNFLCGWPWFASLVSFLTGGRITPDMLAFGGALLSIWEIRRFAFLGGRDFTSPAVFVFSNALLINWIHWGAIGYVLKISSSETVQMVSLALGLLLIAFDTFKPKEGPARTATLLISGIGLAVFIGVKWYSFSTGNAVPDGYYLILVNAIVFIVAAIGSERASKDVESKEGSFRAFTSVLERLWRENQYDAPLILNVFLYIGLRFGWL